jgi:probable HAF family extracellular repeat protein
MSKTGWKAILMFFITLLACGVATAFAGYGARTYTDLHPPGWISSNAVSVNDGGEVAGYGVSPEGGRGFLWSAGRFTTLLPPGGVSCTVSWMNGSGDIVGTAFDAAGTPHAFLYRNGVYIDPTPGWGYSEAFYVGEDGALLGNGDNAALLYIPGKGYLNLLPPGAESASPGRMNEKGLVTFSSSAQGVEKGYVYSGGFMIFMTPPGWTSSKAASINGQSEVVGYGTSPQGEKGFLRSGPEYEEIACPGWTATRPESVNNLGQAAGSGETGSGETHAFLSSPASLSVSTTDTGNGGGASAGGGCTMAGVRGNPVSATGVCNLLLLLGPMMILFARSLLRSRVTRRGT